MAVLVEAISVIVKISSIRDKYRGGWEAFKKDCPNKTLVSDGELARIGFVDPRHVRVLVDRFKMVGFVLAGDGADSDFCVADQISGATTACDWIDLGTVPADGDATHTVTAARLKGSQLKSFMRPDGWKFEGSISEKPGFISAVDALQRLKYLRTEGNMDVFWDPAEGKEVSTPKRS
jgi:hypothetical protein